MTVWPFMSAAPVTDYPVAGIAPGLMHNLRNSGHAGQRGLAGIARLQSGGRKPRTWRMASQTISPEVLSVAAIK
jgi:hypothetical protein